MSAWAFSERITNPDREPATIDYSIGGSLNLNRKAYTTSENEKRDKQVKPERQGNLNTPVQEFSWSSEFSPCSPCLRGEPS